MSVFWNVGVPIALLAGLAYAVWRLLSYLGERASTAPGEVLDKAVDKLVENASPKTKPGYVVPDGPISLGDALILLWDKNRDKPDW